jgi:hypothetical protein
MWLAFALMLAAQQRSWTTESTPSVSIGEIEGAQPYMFAQVVGAVRLSDGRLVVANAGSSELRVYDARGAHLNTLGRSGSGPGEFLALRALWLMPADTLLVADSRNARVSVYAPGPTLVRSIQLATAASITGRMADGAFLFTIGIAPPEKVAKFEGLVEYNGFVLRRTAESTAFDTIARGKAGQSFVQPAAPSFRQYPFPFGRTAQIAVGPTRFYYADTHTTEIGVYGPRGERMGSVRIRGSGRALSGSDFQRWVDEDVAKRATEQAKLDAREGYKQIPPPARTPEFAALKLDDDGNLWVRRYGPPWDPSPDWDVHTADGAPLANVKLPQRFEPMHIGRDFVLGVRKDALDVEHVELYRLTRR